ncbi:flagellar export chaperone FlgN [Dethiosulfovibrio salsuginis]|uniref:FlgN protein n=1 Tax=Dethiosulfovibrio salsuginis TaxID=561720 RepID=A0A1X7IUG2_9BACT|nr:flagellar export chaperone FlgN [Dethiosulfovibrio salsuginis]SMG18698.1 FlgN protein [Dethiosulfovibrio salsuginis]
MWQAQLIQHLSSQTKAIEAVLDVVKRQREALKEGRLELLTDLMQELDRAQRQASVEDSLRSALVTKIASEQGCDPTLDSLVAVSGPKRDELLSAGKALRKTVTKAQSEIQILGTLVEESKALNEMMINEWRRLGSTSSEVSGLDLKG